MTESKNLIRPLGIEDKKSANKLQILSNIILIALLGLYTALTFFIVANWKNVLFSVRRPDIMEAARKVESEESRLIEEQIKETRKGTLKRILSPVVINSEK